MSGAAGRRRLELRAPVHAPDGAGGSVRDWVARGAFWGSVAATGGRARTGETGIEPVLRVQIVLRAMPVGHEGRPAPGDRLVEAGRTYLVDAVHEADPDGRFLTCWAREAPAGGGS